jgi:lantibiotic modifying enzyme
MRRSFFSGWIGIAYSAVQVGMQLRNGRLVEDGLQLAGQAVTSDADDHLLDVISGNAGAIAPLVWLAKLPGAAALRTAATVLAEELADAATRTNGAWSWDNERASGGGVGATPLCGFAHGASGMGLALIEMGVHCERSEWIEGGLSAFKYEDKLFDVQSGNWPDLREWVLHDRQHGDAQRSTSMVAWCHGAAGIGLARLRAYRLLPEHRGELIVGVQRAIHAATNQLRVQPPRADASPCHGRAGVAETLLYAADVLQDSRLARRVARNWLSVIHPVGTIADWPCGVASGRNNPSYMLGYAGTGYALIRSWAPKAVRPLLLIESS